MRVVAVGIDSSSGVVVDVAIVAEPGSALDAPAMHSSGLVKRLPASLYGG